MVFVLRYCELKKDSRERLEANTALIQNELKNVGKLIVTEGSYSQILTHKSSNSLLNFDWLSSQKKALIVIDAKASIAYDLSKVETIVDENNKTVTITRIPEPELSIIPNLQYYDLQQHYFNQFKDEDFNRFSKNIEDSLRKKIEASELRTNAENRLISELQKIYVLTNSMGWTLKYENETIQEEEDFQKIKL